MLGACCAFETPWFVWVFLWVFCPWKCSCQRQSEQTDKRQPKEKRVKLTITFYLRHWGPSTFYRQCRKSHYMLLLTHNKMVSSYPLRLEPYNSFPFPIVLRYLFFYIWWLLFVGASITLLQKETFSSPSYTRVSWAIGLLGPLC